MQTVGCRADILFSCEPFTLVQASSSDANTLFLCKDFPGMLLTLTQRLHSDGKQVTVLYIDGADARNLSNYKHMMLRQTVHSDCKHFPLTANSWLPLQTLCSDADWFRRCKQFALIERDSSNPESLFWFHSFRMVQMLSSNPENFLWWKQLPMIADFHSDRNRFDDWITDIDMAIEIQIEEKSEKQETKLRYRSTTS
jgi:hypothetical protein